MATTYKLIKEKDVAIINGVEFTVRQPAYTPKAEGYTKTNCVYADISVLNTGIKYLFIKLDDPEGEFDIETATPEELERVVLEANTITLGVVRKYLTTKAKDSIFRIKMEDAGEVVWVQVDSETVLDELIKEAMSARKAERVKANTAALEEVRRKEAQLRAALGL